MNSQVLPVGTGPQRSGSSYPVGSGCCFCRVILSCPEGSWPKATFLVGSECHRARKHPFSPQLPSPTQAGHSSLCQQQALSSQAGCPQNPGPPETLSPWPTRDPEPRDPEPKTLSPWEAKNISWEGHVAGPVPEGRGGDMGVKELCTVFACLLGGPPASGGGGPAGPLEKSLLSPDRPGRNQISTGVREAV